MLSYKSVQVVFSAVAFALAVFGPVAIAAANIMFTTQPQDQTVEEGRPYSFSVDVTGTAPINYQWQRNGVAISGAIDPEVIGSASLADDGAMFNVHVSNPVGAVTSDTALLTVFPDTTPPSVLSATATIDGLMIDVVFDWSVEVSFATDPFSYLIDPFSGFSPSSVSSTGPASVKLNLDSPLVLPADLVVFGIQDLAGNLLAEQRIAITTVPEPSAFLYGGLISVLAGCGYRIKRRAG